MSSSRVRITNPFINSMTTDPIDPATEGETLFSTDAAWVICIIILLNTWGYWQAVAVNLLERIEIEYHYLSIQNNPTAANNLLKMPWNNSI